MLGLKHQTWISIFGALLLITILVVQVLPSTASLFDVEITQNMECEESDADEKDIEEEQESDKKFWNEAHLSMQLTHRKTDVLHLFLEYNLSGPYLEEHLPPPDYM